MPDVDLAIIGGGIVGCSVAYYAARAGISTVLIERHTLNDGGSGTTAGNIHIQGVMPRDVGGHMGALASMLQLQRGAANQWRMLAEEIGDELEVRFGGGYMVAETEHDLQLLRAKHELELAAGVQTDLLSGEQARSKLPSLSDRVIGATYCADDGYANPLRTTPALAEKAAQYGMLLRLKEAVKKISRSPNGTYELITSNQSWKAKWVVNAAGHFASQIARMVGISLPVGYRNLQMLATERTSKAMGSLVQHISRRLSVKQVSAGNFIVGGGWPAEDASEARPRCLLPSIEGNLRVACDTLPQLRKLRLIKAWAGPVAITKDHIPACGEVASRPGFYIATGIYAFTLAPVFAEALVQHMLTKKYSFDLNGFLPDRLVT